MNETIKHTYPADLSHLVFSERRTGVPVIEPERRERLVGALEGVLANVNDFDAHYALLNRHYHGHFPFADTLSEAQTSGVLTNGLRVLEDAVLVRLALNPVALYRLSEQIAEQFPVAWREVLRVEGAQMRLQPSGSAGAAESQADDESWLSSLSTVATMRPPLVAKRMVWEWQLTPGDCEWQRRNLQPDETAELRAEWHGEGVLSIALEGFLAGAAGVTTEATWLRLAGETAATGKSQANGELRLRAGNTPPRSWDRLRLRQSGGSKAQAWVINVTVAF